MSEKYIPLYRKYRPKNLQEVVGQEHVKKALTNAIELKKISHAYLFTGPRGTGKTSIARILAKSLNCQEGPTLTPCEVCPSCIDIKNSTPIDVIEIDAASNRKVEDARNILEKIQYIPANGKFKIYIIDEVHMLTKEAFNTLLKTLEEPPENVIFILATTEPQKVLETITSRCQRFDFRRITTDDIIAHLKHIAKLEKIKIDDEALFTIAKNAAGGMRDSLALLDQVSVLDNTKTITSEDVNRLLGRISFDMLNALSDNLIQSQPQAAIELLDKIYNSGNEPSQILINLLGYLKNLLIVKNCQGDELLIDLTQLNNSQIKILKAQSENIETHQIVFLIEKTIYYVKELKTTTSQHLWLEIAIIDLANLAQNTSLLALQERVSRLEGNTVQSVVAQPYITKPAPIAREEKPAFEAKKEIQREETSKQESKPEVKQEPKKEINQEVKQEIKQTEETQEAVVQTEADGSISDLWRQLLQHVSSPPTIALLSDHSKPLELTQEKVVIVCEKEFSLKALSSDLKKKVIGEAAQKLFNNPKISVVIRLATPSDKLPVIEKKNPIIKQRPVVEEKEDEEEALDDGEFMPETSAETVKDKDKDAPYSDQVSMVMNLFNGKYID